MLKRLFFFFFVKPLILLIMGVHVTGRQHLPQSGPFILAANHNSHLDTLLLMHLFDHNQLSALRPVASEEFFMGNAVSRWFAKHVMTIIPVPVNGDNKRKHAAMDRVLAWLSKDGSVIIFPEGSRGEPGVLGEFKTGIAHLARSLPNVPVIPVFIKGSDRCLPKNEALFVPFITEVHIGEPLYWAHERCREFTDILKERIVALNPSS